MGLYLREVEEGSVRSIIGATEKRRESGAGVAEIGDIGGSGLGGAGRWGSLSGMGDGRVWSLVEVCA